MKKNKSYYWFFLFCSLLSLIFLIFLLSIQINSYSAYAIKDRFFSDFFKGFNLLKGFNNFENLNGGDLVRDNIGISQEGDTISIYNNLVFLNMTRAKTNFDMINIVLYDRRNNSLLAIDDKFGSPYKVVGSLSLKNGSKIFPVNFTYLGNNLFNFTYPISGAFVVLEIIPEEDHIFFRINNYSNLPINIDRINLFYFFSNKSIHSTREDLKLVGDYDVVFDSLPLTYYTLTNNGGFFYFCSSDIDLNLINASCVLLTSYLSNYYDVFEKVVDKYRLPKVVLEDGVFYMKSPFLREGYLFVTLNKNNKDSILDYVKRSKFRQILLIDPVKYSLYNETRPWLFDSNRDFMDAIDILKSRGVKVGIHTFINSISIYDGTINLINPKWPLENTFFNVRVGVLNSDIGPTNTSIYLNENLEENTNLSYYMGNNSFSLKSNMFIIGNELIFCESYSGNSLRNCQRGKYGSVSSFHPSGSNVSIIPLYYGGDNQMTYLINPNNEELMNRSINSFVDLQRKVGFNFVYNDGLSFVSLPSFTTSEEFFHYSDLIGVIPYIRRLDRIPFMQYGGAGGFLLKYAVKRYASDDGAVFKNKEYTKQHKISMISQISPYFYQLEMGWWKITGANFTSGLRDFDATNFDDVHYAMVKSLVLNSSMGLQFGPFYEEHGRLNELLELIGLYNDLIDLDISNNIVPSNIKNYLSSPDKEAEISNVSGWNLVEKVVKKQYCAFEDLEGCSFVFENLFESQPLNVQIRPRFDYYGYDDSRNLLIRNFSVNSDSLQIQKNKPSVSCSLTREGVLTIVNDYDPSQDESLRLYACKITIPGNIDMSYRRGFGLRIVGDGKDEIIVVRAKGGVDFDIDGRDYKFNVNFSGERVLILADPSNDERDVPKGIIDWGVPNSKYKSWDKDFSKVKGIDIYIKTINPGVYNIQFKELKALMEKGNSSIVSPSISVNDNLVTFPVTLSINDFEPNILEYHGRTGEYKVYDSNYNFLSRGFVEKLSLKKGSNSIFFVSNTSSLDFSKRAEIMISAYDDEDGDMVPSNGNYDEIYYPCNGRNNFCDDNCPSSFNPDQSDSDGDGKGDACDSNEEYFKGKGSRPAYYFLDRTRNGSTIKLKDDIDEDLKDKENEIEENPQKDFIKNEKFSLKRIFYFLLFFILILTIFLISLFLAKKSRQARKVDSDLLLRKAIARAFELKYKGFKREEVKRIFIESGWDEKVVENYIINNVFKI